MTERVPLIDQEEVDYIFERMDFRNEVVEHEEPDIDAEDHQPTLSEIYFELIDRGCSVEEIEVMHYLKMDENGEVRELTENEIQEREKAIYEV